MNDPFEDVELELKSLRPAPPPARLTRRIASRLGSAPLPLGALFGPGRRVVWRWAVLTTAVTAAGVALVWLAGWVPPRSPEVALASRPDAPRALVEHPAMPSDLADLRQRTVVVEARDEGVVYASGTLPLRQIRCQMVSGAQWRNPRDNSTVQILRPSERVLLVPLNVQ